MHKQNFFGLLIIVLLSGNIVLGQTTPNGQGANAADLGSMLSLPQAVKIAIKNNLLVNQADLQMQSGKINLNQAWDNMLPTINGSATQTRGIGRSLNTYTYTYTNATINSGTYGVNASLPLFSGLTIQNGIRQYGYAYDASKMDLQQQKDNITLSVLLAYLQVLSSQDQLNIAKEQAVIDAKQVDRLDLQNREGALLLLSNLTDLRGQYAGDEVNIAAAVNTLETAKVNLFQLLNIPYKSDVEYDRGAFTLQLNDHQESSDSIYQTALRTLPSVKSSDLKVKANQKALAVARGQYFPTLSFGVGLNTNYTQGATENDPTTISDNPTNNYVNIGGSKYTVIAAQQQNFNTKVLNWGDQFKDNKYTSLGLTLNIPILNNLRVRNNVKNARLNLKNAEYNANNTRLALQQSVEMAYQNMIAAYKQYKSYIDQAAAYAESFRTTEIRFNEGVINSDVYVIAKNNIDRANTNLSQAKYVYILRTKVLEYYQGRLTW
jgi:outer membrane protein